MESRVMTLVYSLCKPEIDGGALAALCAAACKWLEDKLADGITVEDCGSVFHTAASLIVMDWLKEARHWEGITAVSSSTSSSKSSSESVSESASESASQSSSEAVSQSASESESESTSVSQSSSDETTRTASSNSSSTGGSTGSSSSHRTSGSTSSSTGSSSSSSSSDGSSVGSSSSTRWDLSTIGQLERRALAMMEPYLKKEVGLYVCSVKG